MGVGDLDTYNLPGILLRKHGKSAIDHCLDTYGGLRGGVGGFLSPDDIRPNAWRPSKLRRSQEAATSLISLDVDLRIDRLSIFTKKPLLIWKLTRPRFRHRGAILIRLNIRNLRLENQLPKRDKTWDSDEENLGF